MYKYIYIYICMHEHEHEQPWTPRSISRGLKKQKHLLPGVPPAMLPDSGAPRMPVRNACVKVFTRSEHGINHFENLSGPFQVWSASSTHKLQRRTREVWTKNELAHWGSAISVGQRPSKAQLVLH